LSGALMSSALESHCISFREIPQTTPLLSAFLEDFGSVASYYAHPPTATGIDAAAREIAIDPDVRRTVAEVLREQNRSFGADASTQKNIDRLAAGAAAIVTGQQVGIFSGPAYTLYKAISAIRCAEEATRRGTDAVPVFWLATEDHDLAEVNHCTWNTRKGLVQYDFPARAEDTGKRVGEIGFGEPIGTIVALAAQSLEGAFVDDIVRILRESYTPEDTFGSAFGKLLARLFAGRGIIFMDPLDARFHQLCVPVYRRAIEQNESLREKLLARSKELEQAGFHAQVKVTRESTLLFYNVDGRREPLRSRNGKFLAGKLSLSQDEVLSLLAKAPLDFTPNALFRPIIQDTLLPTAAYIGGPGEIAYLAQSKVIYDGLLGHMPAILPRASFTIVEAPVANLLRKYELDLRDFFRGRQNLRAKMEEKVLPRALARRFEKDEKALQHLFDGYRHPLGKLDSTLSGVLDSGRRKMLYQFSKLKGKAARAEGFRTGVLDRHERILIDSLYPHRDLQERSLCALPFLAEYGLEFLDELAGVSPAPGTIEKLSCSQQHHVFFVK